MRACVHACVRVCDWPRVCALVGAAGDEEAPPDAAAVLKGLGDPKAYAEKEAKPPPPVASAACALQ